MTPNDIEILLHGYTTPLTHPRVDAPAVQEALSSLASNGLIENYHAEQYRTTERGKAHIEQLCCLPWPILTWVGADGKIINES